MIGDRENHDGAGVVPDVDIKLPGGVLESRRVTGEDQVVILAPLVTGKARFEDCLRGGFFFAPVEMCEPPAARRGVFF